MAIFADIAGLYVRRRLAGCIRAVMAIDAIARDIDMVEVRWQPGHRRVTIVAVIATGNVGRVLAGRDVAVMATAAGPDYLRVVNNRDRTENIRIVAVLADIRCLYMGRSLPRGVSAIVAARAIVDDIRMIEIGWQPGCRGVAVVAIIAARDVRWMLSGCRNSVVT